MNYINLRLQEIKGCTKFFGNVSVFAVGDLFLLKPVSQSSHNDTILSDIASTDKIYIQAIDTVSGNVSSSIHTKILSKIPRDPRRTMGLQKNP